MCEVQIVVEWRRKLKRRSKILLAASVLLITLLGVLAWSGREGLDSLRKKARQPENIREVANQVAEFVDPLPDGFNFRSGISMPLSNSLSVQHAGEFMIISIVSDQKMSTGFAPLDASFNTGMTLGKRFSDAKWTKKSDGETMVAGDVLKYELGEVTMSGHRVGELRGLVSLKNKSISFDAFGEWDKPFNMERLESFLACIKSFK